MKNLITKWINLAKNNDFVQLKLNKFKKVKEYKGPKKIMMYVWEWAIMLPSYVYYNRHNTSLMISSAIALIIVSSSVWIPGLIALFTKGWVAMISVATTGIGIWNLPGTPFLLITLGLGIAINEIYKKIRNN